jgi:PAS domain S-box-containing protein
VRSLRNDAETAKVYIVDDDPSVVRALERQIAHLGYRVCGSALGPHDAMVEIPYLAPDVVLLDVDLQHAISGVDIAVHLAARADVAILFLTAATEVALAPLAQHDRVYGYLPKPFGTFELRAALEFIATQQRARRRLLALQRRYHALFEHSAHGVAQVDGLTGCFVEVNRRCADIFGYSPAGLLAVDLHELVEDESHPALVTLFSKDSASGSIEARCRRHDGSRIWTRITGSLLMVPGEPTRQHVLIFEDVTERRRAEEALRMEQHLLAESQRIGTIGSWTVDLATRKVKWTEEMYRIHGVDRGFDPSLESVIELVEPDDRPLALSAIDALPHLPEFTIRIRTPQGQRRVVSVRGEPVVDELGRLTGSMGTVQDVTDRVRAEEARRSSEARELRLVAHNEQLELIIDATRLGLWDWNPQSDELRWNDRLAEMVGEST